MKAWSATRFAVKHAVATAVVVGGVVLFAGASYFALLLWAVFVGEPLGGPLAFPFMVLAAFVGSALAVAFILPTTAMAEWIRRWWRLHLAAEIPLASALLLIAVLSTAMANGAIQATSMVSAGRTAAVVWALLLIPLGVYWWSLQGTDWLLGAIATCAQHVKAFVRGSNARDLD